MHKISVKDDQYVWARCPVRLDPAGGWSDTPPYTFRHGGKVVNLAVNLNGGIPIQVYVCRSKNPHIKVHSIHLGSSEVITKFEQITNYRDLNSPFPLSRAVLHLLGFDKNKIGENNLAGYLKKIGGGFEITTFVAVPKGSGLGVSSILSATLLAAMHRFLGEKYTWQSISREVLRIEEMLTTGGGWQDQIGGIIGGIKYAENNPCDENFSSIKLEVDHLNPYLFEEEEMRQCFTIYYTGITRLAKNILQEVVKKVESKDEEYLKLHGHIKELAERARVAVSKRNLNDFGKIMHESWEAKKKIHPSATNKEIEALLKKTRPHYIGAKLLGAGGGGYCLFASKNRKSAEKLRAVLKRVAKGNARLIDWELNTKGLEVTVS